ncbi:glycosyltransferase family 2 protein [Verrucomicrobiota bacterium]
MCRIGTLRDTLQEQRDSSQRRHEWERRAPALVSVIIAAYGRPGLLCKALDSVVAQYHRPIELIIVDDGSPVSLEPTVAAYQDRDPELEVVYVRQENAGPGAARNHGVAISKGEFIAFLDSDDLWFPEMLAVTSKRLHERPEAHLVCGGWDMLHEDEREDRPFTGGFMPSRLQAEVAEDFVRAELMRNLFPIHAVLMRRECFAACGGFNEKMPALEDWDFWLRAAACGFRISFMDVPVARWRSHPDVRRSRGLEAFSSSISSMFDSFFARPDEAKRWGQLRLHAEALAWMNRVVYYQNAGAPVERSKCMEHACGVLPRASHDETVLPHYFRVLDRIEDAQGLRSVIEAWAPGDTLREWAFDRCEKATRSAVAERRWGNALCLACKAIVLGPHRSLNIVVCGVMRRLQDHSESLRLFCRKRREISCAVRLLRLSRRCQSRNRGRPRVFLYTDSRGFRITRHLAARDPLHFYPRQLIERFNVEFHISPERHTTFVDFLRAYDESSREFDVVIAHVGIVDFSPRQQTSARDNVYLPKKVWYDNVFGEEAMVRHLRGDLGVKYEGDKTINMFSLEMAECSLLPRLLDIPNLVWVGCNKFVKGWEGNYFRERPANMSIVEGYSELFCKSLPDCIDLSDWSDEDIRKYTCDNIHLTVRGWQVLLGRLREVIQARGISW